MWRHVSHVGILAHERRYQSSWYLICVYSLQPQRGEDEVPMRCSEVRREAVLRKLLPPDNRPVPEIAALRGATTDTSGRGEA